MGHAIRDGTRCHPLRGNTSTGQRGSRRLADTDDHASRDSVPEVTGHGVCRCLAGEQTERARGACGPALKPRHLREGSPVTVARVANRIREIRPSGMRLGARRNVTYGGNGNPPRNRKGGAGNPPPEGARASILSRPSDRPGSQGGLGNRDRRWN